MAHMLLHAYVSLSGILLHQPAFQRQTPLTKKKPETRKNKACFKKLNTFHLPREKEKKCVYI